MAPERWLLVQRLYQEALERGAQEREEFLDHACAGDEELRGEVGSLLAAHNDGGNFLSLPALALEADELRRERGALVGRRFNQFQIVSWLDAGGMGEVYLARDTRLDREVALKLLPGRFTRDSERLRRFEREARAASALNHPNIITIHEIGETNGTRFIATEFVEGITLRQRLKAGRPDLSETLEIATQVATALAAAHRRGIIHRDIKPENIMLRPDGLVKVLDFGLATSATRLPIAQCDLDAVSTETGAILGTPRYMSPEQARGMRGDALSDIFSFGVVLYEMITGTPPFTGAAGEVFAALLEKEPTPISRLVPDIPPDLEDLVNRALRKDRQGRYQTAEDLLRDLKDLKEGAGNAAGRNRTRRKPGPAKTDRSEAIPPAGAKVRKPSPRIAAVTVLVLLSFGALGWWLATGLRPSDAEILAALHNSELTNWKSETGEGGADGTISPDGQRIAFTMTRGGSSQIWHKLVGEGVPVQLTHEGKYNRNPIWSADGKQIAYLSQEGNRISIWRIPAIGGPATSVGVLPHDSVSLKYWSNDRARIYYESLPNLYAFDVNTGKVTQITRFDMSASITRDFSLSPEEGRLAYVEVKGGKRSINVMPIGGGDPVQLLNDAVSVRNLVWHPDGKRIFYSSDQNGIFQVFVARLDGRPPLRLTTEETDSMVTSVSADGTKILYGVAREESSIWGVEANGGREFEISSNLGLEFWPDVSPDSARITYQAVRGSYRGPNINHSSILTKSVTAESQQARLAANGFSPSWSPDGSKLAFLRSTANLDFIWTVRSTGGEPLLLTPRGVKNYGYSPMPFNRSVAKYYDWSPDGSQIVYVSQEPGQESIEAASSAGTGTQKIVSHIGPDASLLCPLWSPDGKHVTYVSASNVASGEGTRKNIWKVWLADVGANKSEVILQSEDPLRVIGWSSGGKEVILATAQRGKGSESKITPEVSLIRVSPDGSQRPMALLKSVYFSNPNIRLSPDKQTVAYASRQNGKDNIWLVPVTGGAARMVTNNIDVRTFLSSLSWAPDGRTIYFAKQASWGLIKMIEPFN